MAPPRRYPDTPEQERKREGWRRRSRGRWKKLGLNKSANYAERVRDVSPEAVAERDQAFTVELTPGQALLGDPLPGRSALDRMRADE